MANLSVWCCVRVLAVLVCGLLLVSSAGAVDTRFGLPWRGAHLAGEADASFRFYGDGMDAAIVTVRFPFRNRTGMGGESPFQACLGFPGQGPGLGELERRRSARDPPSQMPRTQPTHPGGSATSVSTGPAIQPARRGLGDDRGRARRSGIQFRFTTTTAPKTTIDSVTTGLSGGGGPGGPSLAELLRCGGDRAGARRRQGLAAIGSQVGENSTSSRPVASRTAHDNAAVRRCAGFVGLRGCPSAISNHPSSRSPSRTAGCAYARIIGS